jgi:hypothetical protein
LSLEIWKSGLQIFFAPLSHSIWPDSSILIKPKLSHLEKFYTFLMLAYDKDLDDYLLLNISSAKNYKYIKSKKILQNIRFLLRSAIPFVSY